MVVFLLFKLCYYIDMRKKVSQQAVNLLEEEQIVVKEAKRMPKFLQFKTHKVKDFFIPHHGNDHHPHLLHTKRAVFYSAFFILVKFIAVGFAAVIPMQAFLAPDVLAEQRAQLIAMVENLRQSQNANQLGLNAQLDKSAYNKVDDMLEYSYFSHVSPNGYNLAYFLNQANYEYTVAGENLAMGFSSADEVMQAWMKSPLHYRNLIDTDFKEIGIGITSGLYKDKDTVFIAQHFGAPIVSETALINTQPISEDQLARADLSENKPVTEQQSAVLPAKVQAEPVIEEIITVKTPQASVSYNQARSKVSWSEEKGNTIFNIKAYIGGEVASAFVYIDEYPIKLDEDKFEHNLYKGSLTVNKDIDEFFKVVVHPSIIILAEDGTQITDSIYWSDIKVVSPSPWEKYVSAKKILPVLTSRVFNFTNKIIATGIIIFTLVLILTIFIERQKQHPHIIAQTLSLILLLGVLWII